MAGISGAASHLSNGCINLSLIRDESRRELLGLLDKCAGSKVSQQFTKPIFFCKVFLKTFSMKIIKRNRSLFVLCIKLLPTY